MQNNVMIRIDGAKLRAPQGACVLDVASPYAFCIIYL